jgi:hypothetical protein
MRTYILAIGDALLAAKLWLPNPHRHGLRGRMVNIACVPQPCTILLSTLWHQNCAVQMQLSAGQHPANTVRTLE